MSQKLHSSQKLLDSPELNVTGEKSKIAKKKGASPYLKHVFTSLEFEQC